MPTVPSERPMRDTRETILGTRSKSWPVGQVGPSEFKTLRREIWSQTAEAQHAEVEVGQSVGIKPEAWQRFMQKGPKSKNIEERGPEQPLTGYERAIYNASVKKADEAYMAKGQVKPSPLGQPSMKGIATKEMDLNPQEQNLYDHHLNNLAKGGVKNADGTTSTLLATTMGYGDKTYVIPTIWGGKFVGADQGMKNALKAGIDKFPSYDSLDEAKQRYGDMHEYMDTDTK